MSPSGEAEENPAISLYGYFFPAKKHSWQQKKDAPRPILMPDITRQRDQWQKMSFLTDRDTTLRDFYWYYDRGLKNVDTSYYERHSEEKALPVGTQPQLNKAFLYEISFSNKGGLIMPLLLRLVYVDGTSERRDYQAFIWRKNPKKIKILLCLNKKLASVQLDPDLETADIDIKNNFLEVPSKRTDIYVHLGEWEETESLTPMSRVRE